MKFINLKGKRFLFSVVFLLLSGSLLAQGAWVRKYDFLTTETAADAFFLKTAESGQSYFACYITGFLGQNFYNSYLFRFNTSGALQPNSISGNNQVYNWSPNVGVTYSDVLETMSGKTVMVGQARNSYSFLGSLQGQTYLQVLNSNGTSAFVRKYDHPSSIQSVRVRKGAANEWILLSNGPSASYLTAVDTFGTVLWSKTIPAANEFIRTSDLGYLIAGKGLLKIDAAGNFQWRRSYAGVLSSVALRETPGGQFTIACTDTVAGLGVRPTLFRTDAAGNVIWSKYYDDGSGLSYNPAWRATTCSDGGFAIMTGHPKIIRTDSLGNMIWTKHYPIACPANTGTPWGIGQMNDGGFIFLQSFTNYLTNTPIAGTDLHGYRFYKTDVNGDIPCQTLLAAFTMTSFTLNSSTQTNTISAIAPAVFNPPVFPITYPSMVITDMCPGAANCSLLNASLAGNATTFCGNTFSLTDYSTGSVYSTLTVGSTTYTLVPGSAPMNTGSFTVPGPGNYTATLITFDGCCSDTTTLNITVNPAPAMSLGPDLFLCAGGSATLAPVSGGPFTTYAWSTGATSPSITVTSTGWYNLTVSNGGCSASDQIYVNFSNPVPNLGPNIIQCGNAPVTLATTVTFPTYAWSTGANTTTITVTNSGNYTVTVTNAYGCQGTDNIVVAMNPMPVPNLGPDVIACTGNTINLSPGTFPTYNWSTGASSSSISVTTSGTYRVTVTNGFNCTAADTVNVVFTAGPVLNLGPDVTQCGNNPVTLDAGGGFTTYSWSNGATTQTTTATTSGTYTVTVTAAGGCSANDALVVTMNPNPVPNLGPDISQCGNNAVTLSPGGAFATYSWSTGASTSSISTTTSGTYSVTVTNASGCSANDNINVTLHPQPTVNLGPDIVQCGSAPVTLTVPGAFTSYNWSNSGTTATTAVTSSGTYSVTATDANGCTATDAVMVTMHPEPVVNLGPDTLACDTIYILDAGAGFSSYQWSDNSTNPTFTVTGNGTYAVTVTDANGCTGSDAVQVQLMAPPLALFTFNANTLTVIFTDQSSNATSWLWDFGDGQFATNQNPLHVYSTPGDYFVCLTVSNACGSDTRCNLSTFSNGGSTSTDEDALGKWELFPNPTQDQVTLRYSLPVTQALSYQLTDATGRICLSGNLAPSVSGSFSLDLSALSAGVYHLQVNGSEHSKVFKVGKMD